MRSPETKTSGKIVMSVIVIFLVTISLQFTSPVISNPPVTGEFVGPDSIAMIFKRACYDCHSNETRLAWYDKIAPISWKVADDVLKARKRLNFSQWDSLSAADQLNKLWYIVNMIDQDKMPLASYTTVNPSARISKTDIEVLKKYVTSLSTPKLSSTPKIFIPVKTTVKIKAENTSSPLPTSLNGIAYFADYKNWKVITSTNRFDNGTIRIIYGNDIAVKAIQENTIDPWPNGTSIVKVVWNKLPEDENGNIYPGPFNNIQFMIRDDKKFKDTEGWGFARFSTPALLPYGKTASFDLECISCHRLASANGFVFDIPTKKIALKKPIYEHTF